MTLSLPILKERFVMIVLFYFGNRYRSSSGVLVGFSKFWVISTCANDSYIVVLTETSLSGRQMSAFWSANTASGFAYSYELLPLSLNTIILALTPPADYFFDLTNKFCMLCIIY